MSALFDIKGRVIVITGATGVLGMPVVSYLTGQGAQVVILARNEEKARTLCQSVPEGKCDYILADLLSKESLEAAYETMIARYEKVDVLINMAGGNQAGATIPPDKTIYDVDLDAIRGVIDVNLMGTLIPTLVFSRSMAERGEGSIINIASLSAIRPLSRVMGYGMAKSAIVNLTQYLCGEMALKFSPNIRVNAIAPGFFLTEQNRALLENEDGTPTDRAKAIIAHTPFARFGKAEELLGAVHYLSADASRFMSGEVMVVDGGFNAFCL